MLPDNGMRRTSRTGPRRAANDAVFADSKCSGFGVTGKWRQDVHFFWVRPPDNCNEVQDLRRRAAVIFAVLFPEAGDLVAVVGRAGVRVVPAEQRQQRHHALAPHEWQATVVGWERTKVLAIWIRDTRI